MGRVSGIEHVLSRWSQIQPLFCTSLHSVSKDKTENIFEQVYRKFCPIYTTKDFEISKAHFWLHGDASELCEHPVTGWNNVLCLCEVVYY